MQCGDYLHSPHYHNGNIPAAVQQEQISRDMQTRTNCPKERSNENIRKQTDKYDKHKRLEKNI